MKKLLSLFFILSFLLFTRSIINAEDVSKTTNGPTRGICCVNSAENTLIPADFVFYDNGQSLNNESKLKGAEVISAINLQQKEKKKEDERQKKDARVKDSFMKAENFVFSPPQEVLRL
ncbi:MAG: hypothetical protein NTY12_00370 [Candidatus Falkowbacteria bacterium]|nr:hypothetical protein [Candidatus Falkowbacteria bacterium]